MSVKSEKRIMRHKRVRAKVKGTSERPRLSVFRSNRHVFVQMIDDEAGRTLVSLSDREPASSKSKKEAPTRIERATRVGEKLAEKAAEKNIREAVFDRGGWKYHGIIKAIAEGARKGGLKL